jgi:SAM-dependent methyltransferase
MTAMQSDRKFTGYIPDVYETYFVPLLFAPYAEDLAQRVVAIEPDHVLELAAGTGVVTRALDATLADGVALVATDLNQAMLDKAKSATKSRRPIDWRQSDAMQLPFPNGSFDAIACQFGVMFFPEKHKAFSEAHRVLQPGGTFIFNTWDRIEENELAATVMHAMARHFPDNPAAFFARVPHGYYATETIARDLAAGGFTRAPEIATLTLRARAASAHDAAIAFCQGSPLRNEIEERAPGGIDAATEAAAAAIVERFGSGPIDAKMQAHIITMRK